MSVIRDEPIKGVNLGGWLVLEKWITPTLFKDVSAKDEYTYCKAATSEQLDKLKTFRDTFITEQDFRWLKQNGISSVRLPVGYWLFGDVAPYVKTVDYVDLAFEWAEKYGLSVLLDLHGLKGSQNGAHHSGRAGSVSWHRDPRNILQALDVLERLARRYRDSDSLLGLSLLNEPHPIVPKRILTDFYIEAYKIIRSVCGDKTWVVYSDGYIPLRWKKELPMHTFQNVYVDTHHYQVHTPIDKVLSSGLNLQRARRLLPRKINELQKYHPVVVGEWSIALGNKWLREKPETEQAAIAKAYGIEQLSAYRDTTAWYFWSYKTESENYWNFRYCVENDLLSI